MPDKSASVPVARYYPRADWLPDSAEEIPPEEVELRINGPKQLQGAFWRSVDPEDGQEHYYLRFADYPLIPDEFFTREALERSFPKFFKFLIADEV